MDDHRIISNYEKKGKERGVYLCEGFECTLEICNEIDDDCDLKIDEHCEEIVKERDFWFAWYAFHPDTELYEV